MLIAGLLQANFSQKLRQEDNALRSDDVEKLRINFDGSIAAAQNQHGSARNYDLFSTTFGGSYCSLRQAIDLDSIRKALDLALREERLNTDTFRWAVIALCKSISACSTTTGHFAQPLSPKKSNEARYRKQRQRSIWHEWVGAMFKVDAYGCQAWRKKNHVFNCDANDLLRTFGKTKPPAVVFADPPYTKDQYSRYYHVYETAIRYDYPKATGKGLYREDRAVSSFSQSRFIDTSLSLMIEQCARIGADLVLSYPTNGLMIDSKKKIPELLKFFFGGRIDITEIKHTHSTLGASKGFVENNVIEVLYTARCS